MHIAWLRHLAPIVILAGSVGCTTLSESSPRSRKMSLEESLIFHLKPFPEGDHRSGDAAFENAQFVSSDGMKLHGWFAEAKEPRAVVLYAHGNASNVAHHRSVLELYRDRLNASILVFDYRGYGRSEGAPSESGVFADARAARAWLATRAGVREQDIVLVGNSLGGGVAIDLAAADGARGLVLENTFTSIPDVAGGHLRLLPVHSLMRSRFDSLAKIGRYRGPLLQAHGDADEVVPFALGLKLFDAANEPKRFVPVPGGGHNDPPTEEYLNALDQFIGSLPK